MTYGFPELAPRLMLSADTMVNTAASGGWRFHFQISNEAHGAFNCIGDCARIAWRDDLARPAVLDDVTATRRRNNWQTVRHSLELRDRETIGECRKQEHVVRCP